MAVLNWDLRDLSNAWARSSQSLDLVKACELAGLQSESICHDCGFWVRVCQFDLPIVAYE